MAPIASPPSRDFCRGRADFLPLLSDGALARLTGVSLQMGMVTGPQVSLTYDNANRLTNITRTRRVPRPRTVRARRVARPEFPARRDEGRGKDQRRELFRRKPMLPACLPWLCHFLAWSA